MMDNNLGVTGAKRSTFRGDTPREVLARLLEEYPTAGFEEIERHFRDELDRHPTFADVFVEYWLANNFRLLTRPSPKEQLKSGRAAVAQQASAFTQRIFSMIVPGIGKELGDATFGDCAKAGGWFSALAKLGKPHEVVGEKLTEKTVASVFRA